MVARELKGVFAYRQEIPQDVLEMVNFGSCENVTYKDYWSDMIKAGMNGRIDLESEFNQKAWVGALKDNQKKAEYKRAKKVTYFRYEDTEDDKGGVNINKISDMIDSYNKIDENDEKTYYKKRLLELQEELIYEGINLKITFENALSGIPSAIEKLGELCQDKVYGNIIKRSLELRVSF